MKLTNLIFILPLIILLDCSKSNNTDYTNVVKEWSGKELTIPDSMLLNDGSFFFSKASDYTIISYIDSTGCTGCTGCNMNLKSWDNFLSKIDSVKGDNSVQFLMIVNSSDYKKINSITKQSSFDYPIFVDSLDIINKKNKLPIEKNLQTFLLDKNNRIITIGNPLRNSAIRNIYLKNIADKNSKNSDFSENSFEYHYSWGTIRPNQKVTHVFNLKNETQDSLVIQKINTSCECTFAKASSLIIPPHECYSVFVSFKDSIMGEFSRKVYISYNIPDYEIILSVSGNISTK